MVRADVFLQVLWQFLSVRLRRLSEFSRGDFLAAEGGEMRSDYLKNSAPLRKSQIHGHTAAFGGGKIIRFLGLKNELAVSFRKRKF